MRIYELRFSVATWQRPVSINNNISSQSYRPNTDWHHIADDGRGDLVTLTLTYDLKLSAPVTCDKSYLLVNFELSIFFIHELQTGAYPEIWIRGGREGVVSSPSFPFPFPSPSLPLPSSPLPPLEVGPLNPARGSGGAL